ncbi:ABC-2 type transport system ATP-binding protein [Natronoarchaeum philippinense]|uniref:ABC-2 type transport system ATP-binding protein n=1 Tax=Natronoarchaeum philippinense TaxID=558529 RepID=A0A285NCZ7_NATPI|nr:ABC-2 type transport system ATP-binding protein [Natronoarchaeum philippinense]
MASPQPTCNSPSDPSTASVVSVTDLVKTYRRDGEEIRAVDGVNFDIERGSTVGFLGPNGAGKTTLIKSILSLIVPTSGRICIAGTDVHADVSAPHKRVSAMLEGARNVYWRLTVRENLEFFSVLGRRADALRDDRINELLERFGLTDEADTVVRELSRGEKQKVSLACTAVQDTDIVFLDEPTLGLDVESTRTLRETLCELAEDDHTTVVLSSHDMDVVQAVCDRAIIMNDGRIVANDTIDNLLELFSTQIYEIAVDECLDHDTRHRLASTVDARAFEKQPDATTFTVSVAHDEFYSLVDTLRSEGLTIESLESSDSSLEDAFLHVIKENKLGQETPAQEVR